MNIRGQITHFSSAIKIFNFLINEGGEARFVGGCVRDAILNKKYSDIDIATTLIPEDVEKILKKHKKKSNQLGSRARIAGCWRDFINVD